ncbi:MAG: cache domain-containing protein, partial [Pelovirga sp.]
MDIIKNMGLSKKLIGGVLLLLLLVSVGIGTVSFYQASSALQNQVETNIPLVAKDGANIVTEVLERHLATVSVLAENPDIKSMDWERQKKALVEMKQENAYLKQYLGFGIVSPDGSLRVPSGDTSQVGDRSFFKSAMQGNTNLSDVLISKILKSPVMVIATPIRNERGEVTGVLIARLNAEWLSKVTDGIGFGEQGSSYIIDGKGTLIAHGNRDFVLNQTNFIEEAKTNPQFTDLATMFQRMTRGETGFDEYPFMGSDRF